MLKGIPTILSPDLLKIMQEMGHGDEIVIGDGNFPGASNAQRLVRLDGNNIPEILDAMLKLFPLDAYVEFPVTLMAVLPNDPYKPVIWDEYKSIIAKYEKKANVETIDKFKFYEKARKAYAVITTGEKALYANMILKKGVVT
jgi:L-fucose mutarotase